MPMYALATTPLIKKLQGNPMQTWYADDAAAVGKVTDLREWWDQLTKEGPDFGYFPNPPKTWLVTKDSFHSLGTAAFTDTGKNITSEGRPYLGVAIGSRKFVDEYVESKVSSWVTNVSKLAIIAKSQPHAAYSALTHGLKSK